MSLSCVYDKWRIKQIGWVGSLGRDKMAEYSDPLFSPRQPTRKVFECLSGAVGEREPGTKARQGAAASRLPVPTLLQAAGDSTCLPGMSYSSGKS